MPRKMRTAFVSFLLAVLLLCPAALSACSRAPKAEDLRADVISLLEAAPEINEVLFGAGLPVLDPSAPENADLYRFSVPESMATYYDVVDLAHSKFTSIDQIRAAALRVYARPRLEPVFASLFEGVSSNLDPSATLVSRPVFIEQDGFLYQLRRSQFSQNYDPARGRDLIFDYSSLRVVRPSSATSVSLSISLYLLANPSKTETKTFRLASTTSGWRLNDWVL